MAIKEISLAIKRELCVMADIENNLKSQKHSYSIDELLTAIDTMDVPTVFKYLTQRIDSFRKQGGTHDAKIVATLNRLKAFRDGADMTFKELDVVMVKQFEKYLIDEGLKPSTVSFYLRCLRSEYNIAVKNGIIEDTHPFRFIQIKKESVTKETLSIDEISAIKNVDLTGKRHLEEARDLFMFSFYAQGMDFIDIAYLRKIDIHQDRIIYNRRKSRQTVSVKIQPEMQAIIDKYPNTTNGYLLPIIVGIQPATDNQFYNKKQAIGRNLKTVAIKAGIKVNITLDTARVSWKSLHETIIEAAHRQLLDQLL